ncbi:hypothetical protein AKH15_07040 [Vibrio parahaemolyticus]|uniref:hypothetical protein n=1 Tax=Vibrio parahaemolyticus TaxID=670 RepID=UPI000812C2D6|nr:hypothetical protein [Vibrio parahaemolyticus]OCQ02071.1 hypothetical protein AKH15_07040 [Vibrio parahaemolyticus]
MHSEGFENYLRLNQAVNTVFFDGKSKDSPVYLDLEDAQRQQLCELLGCDKDKIDAYIGSVVYDSLCWICNDIYAPHLSELRQWETDKENPPPFSGVLLGLALAAEHMKRDGHYSSTNYYQRLFELLSVTDKTRQNRLRSCAKTTLYFWKALNNWLTENDYEYGIPTARQVNAWKFVSYSVSQSLIREAEREQLRFMFEDMGVLNHEGLSINDVVLYLHQWMATSAPSSWLKKIWEQEDLRDRVANAALLELSSYDGISRSSTQNGACKQLYWVAVKNRFPKRGIRIYLTAGHSSQGAVEVIESADTSGQKTFSDGNNDYNLKLLEGTDLAYLGPIESLNLDGILSSPFKLRVANNNLLFSNTPRPIIPLARTDAGSYFKEVAKVTMYTEHILICHDNWKGNVESFLKKHAQEGYSIVNTHGQLPENWCCFEGVVLRKSSPSDVSNNLQCLVPITMGDTIQLKGGVWLHHNIWHTNSPPQVIASTPDGLLGVELRKHSLGPKDEVVGSNIENPQEINFLERQSAAIDSSSNMTLVAISEGKAVFERNIAFRTADKPRKFSIDSVIEHRYVDRDKHYWEGNGVETAGQSETSPIMRGFWTLGVPARKSIEVSCGSYEINCFGEEEPQEVTYDLQENQGLKESCILRGYHYWDCEAVKTPEDRFKDLRFMQCRSCGSKAFVKKPRMNRIRNRNYQRHQWKADVKPLVPESSPPRLEQFININTIVDALCYLGAGTWSAFEKVTSGFVCDPLHTYQLAHNLSDLGYIDILTEPATNRIRRWSVAPATLVITENGLSFLSGFRCNTLIDSLKEALSEFEFLKCKQTDGPDLLGWQLNTLDTNYLESLIQHISTPHGQPVYVRCFPAYDIAASLPTMRALCRDARDISVHDDGKVEKFDPKTNRWQISGFVGAGAYRTAYKGRTYFYVDSDGSAKSLPFEAAKYLSASSANLKLIGYDPHKTEFQCLIGCQPPSLYRRALVACSGLLPEKAGGKLIYTNVPKSVAGTLLQKLYGK